jgi:Carboxypeptidase regulatory-like domain/Secretion system C-terminal sorting domain
LFAGVKNMHKSLMVLLSVLLIAMCAYAEKAKIDDFGNGRATMQLMPRSFNSLLLDETVLYSTTFEDVNGWTRISESVDDDGTFVTHPWFLCDEGGTNDLQGYMVNSLPCMWVSSDDAPNDDHLIETLLSPVVNTQGTDTFVYVVCDLRFNHYNGDSLTVVYSLDGGTTILDYTSILADYEAYPFVLNMSDVAANVASLQVGFRYDDNDSWAYYAGIDNFSIVSSDAVTDFQPPIVEIIDAPSVGFSNYEDYVIVATCTDDVALSSVTLEYGIIDGIGVPVVETLEMTPTGNLDEYMGVIPADFAAAGDSLAYAVVAVDGVTNEARDPMPDGNFYFFEIFSLELMYRFLSVPYEFNDISTTGTIISDGDYITEYLLFTDLGFDTFDWYNFSYDEISICSNGWMAFGHETSTSYVLAIPSRNTNQPNGTFAPCAVNMNPAEPGSGKIYYQMFDGNLVIQYGSPDAPIYFHGTYECGPVFQVVIDPVENVLKVNYHTIAGMEYRPGHLYANYHVIGSEGPNGRFGSVFYQGNDFSMPANESSYLVTAFLGDADGTITSFEDGAALEGAEVRLMDGDEVVKMTTTDVNGDYHIQSIVQDTYDIRATALGYTGSTETGVVIEGHTTATIDFVLGLETIESAIAGIVTDIDGAAPLAGCDVRFVQADVTVQTDGFGAYSFGDYTISDYTIEYNVGNSLAGMHDYILDITTVEGQESIDIDLNQILAPTNLVVDAAFAAATLMFDAPANHMAPPAVMSHITELLYLVDMHYNHNRVVENIEEVEANLAIYQNVYANITSDLELDDIADFPGYRVKQDGTLLAETFVGETFTIVGLTDRTTYTFEVAADYGYGDDFLMFSEAVSGTPISFPYTYADETYEWVEIRTNDLGTAIAYASYGDYSGPINMGMSFNFYDVDYTWMNITNNGYVSFVEDDPSGAYCPWTEAPIPTEDAPNGIAAVLWDNMSNNDDPTRTSYYYYDEATNSFIVTWFFYKSNTQNLLEYQGIFYGDTGEMVFNYNNASEGWESATIGVESQDGTYGTQYPGTGANEMALRFTPPVLIFGSIDGVVTDGDGNGLGGVVVKLDTGHPLGTTEADGSFDLLCPIGTHDIMFDHPDYYPGMASGVVVAEDAATTVPIVVLLSPYAIVDPSSLSFTYDLSELIADPDYTVSDVVTLSNTGDGPLEFSASIRMTPSAPDFFSQARHRAFTTDGSSVAESVAGPVVQELTLDNVWDPWDGGQTWPVEGASVAALVTDEHVMTVLWRSPYTYYVWDHDGNEVLTVDLPAALQGARDFEWDGDFVYTAIVGTGDVYRFPPLNPSDYELVVNSISPRGRGIAMDVETGNFYLSDWAGYQDTGNLGVDILYNNGDGTYTLVPLPIPADVTSPYGLAWMPYDPDYLNLWLFCQLDLDGNSSVDGTIMRVDPITGVGGVGYQVYPDGSLGGGIAGGIEISNSYDPNMHTVATCMQTYQIDLWEGYPGIPSTMTITVDPVESTIQPDGSLNLTVSVHSTEEQPNGVYNAIVIIRGNYFDTVEVPIEITVSGNDTDVDESALPVEYALHQNYPNPFNPTTAIRFDLKAAQTVNLVVFNMLGQEVVNLVDSRMSAGYHSVNFDASHLSSGVYFYRIETEAFTSMKKMVLVK